MRILSQEAIAFQVAAAPKSLANELTSVFQEVIDFRNGITDSDSNRIKLVTDYFVTKAAPKVINIVEKYTGITLTISIPKQLICNWAILMEFEDSESDVESIIKRYSGLLNDKSYRLFLNGNVPIIKTQKELDEFSNSLDKNTGIIEAGMMSKHHFKAKLYFDVYASFLIKEVGAQACDPLTAPEITAVILHEIGHALSFVEHAADMVFKKDVMDMVTREFFRSSDDKEKMNYISDITLSIYPKTSEAIKSLNDYVETAQKNKGSLWFSGIKILLSTTVAILSSLGIGLCRCVLSTLKNLNNATIGGIYKASKSIAETKVSDFYRIPENDQYCELLADEYVSRFGYAGYFTSQLKKIMEWSRITGMGDMRMRQFNGTSFFGRLLPWVIYTAFYGDKYSKDYPTEKARYEHLLLDTLKAFKDNATSDEMMDDYYKAYRHIKYIIDNPTRQQKYITLCNYLHDALEYIVKTPAELIFSGRFDREYERLYKQVQSLSNNDLYALAYALKNRQ